MQQIQRRAGDSGVFQRSAGLLLLTATLGLLGAPGVVQAQDRDGGRRERPQQRDMGRAWGSMVGQNQLQRSDIDLMARVLKLDESQQTLAAELYADLDQQRTALMAGLREKMQALRGEGGERPDGAAMTAFREASEKARQRVEELERVFYEDIKLVLNPEQQQNWASYEKARERARALGAVPRAVDVAAVFGAFASRHEATLDGTTLAGGRALAERFIVEIDRQISDQAKLREQTRPQRGGEGGFDREAMRELMEARREANEKLREVSARYADSIEATLPAELREAFRFEINRPQLVGLMRRGNIIERVQAAASNPALDEAQKQELRSIEAEMHQRFNALAEELVAARGADGGGRDRGREGMGVGGLRPKLQEIEDELSVRLRAVTGGDA